MNKNSNSFRLAGTVGLCGWISFLASANAQDKPQAPVAGYTLAWSEEFDGDKLDADKWVYRTDSKHLSTQKPENVSVKDGVLRVALKKEKVGGKDYTGGGIISVPVFKYGYYEARIKMPVGAGWHTAFWLSKHDGSGTTDPQLAEQGVIIAQNESINHLSYSLKLDKYSEPPMTFGFFRAATPDLSADFHVFGAEFTPATAKYYLDGKLVQTIDATEVNHSEVNIWFSTIASHMGLTAKVDDAALPQETQCDYVRVYIKTSESGPAK